MLLAAAVVHVYSALLYLLSEVLGWVSTRA
jgi:hypothetical protein